MLQDKQTYQGNRVNWLFPPEDANDGCPGGWYQCQFVYSLKKYMRDRSKDGVRSSNPLFDKADEFIQAAVMYYEREENAFYSYWNSQINSKAKMNAK